MVVVFSYTACVALVHVIRSAFVHLNKVCVLVRVVREGLVEAAVDVIRPTFRMHVFAAVLSVGLLFLQMVSELLVLSQTIKEQVIRLNRVL